MKQIVLFLICLSILFFAGCVNNSEIRTDYSDNIDPIEEVISYDLHDFRIVYSSKQNSLAESIKYFKYYIDLYCNTDIQIFTDKNISTQADLINMVLDLCRIMLLEDLFLLLKRKL